MSNMKHPADCMCGHFAFPNGYIGGQNIERVDNPDCPFCHPLPPYLIRRHSDGCWHLTRRGQDLESQIIECTFEFEYAINALDRELGRTA